MQKSRGWQDSYGECGKQIIGNVRSFDEPTRVIELDRQPSSVYEVGIQHVELNRVRLAA